MWVERAPAKPQQWGVDEAVPEQTFPGCYGTAKEAVGGENSVLQRGQCVQHTPA